MAIILDLETNGLMPYCTKIHCAVAYNTNTQEFKEFTPANIDKLIVYLDEISQTDTLSMHNGISFDFKVLKKIYNYNYKGKYIDTLLMSRVLWPDIEKMKGVKSGPHSVEAWGERFHIEKPDYEDWGNYTPEMLIRCKEDVKIQTNLYMHCQKKIASLTQKDLRLKNWDAIWELEQKVWSITEQQSDNGWLFAIDKADIYVNELKEIIKEIDSQLEPLLPINILNKTLCKGVKKDGSPSYYAVQWVGVDKAHTIGGDFSRVIFEKLNVDSSTQLREFLLQLGWNPTEWNFKRDPHNKPLRDDKGKLIKTTPKLPSKAEDWDLVAKESGKKELSLLSERGKASHRLSQIKGLIDMIRPDRRIEARANTCSTNTARMTHKVIVNIPKAKESIYYGKQMRSLFIAPRGKVLVGCDAHALEARCEAHYVYQFDKLAAIELLDGDIHTLNANIFQTSRDIAKNGKYAILYGCSAQKLANVLNKPLVMATDIYNAYWEGNEGLKKLKFAIEQQWEKYGYLVSIDGRPLTIRYKHALLNTLLQSCGAIIMKVALCYLHKYLSDATLNYKLVGNFHDEFQMECNLNDADHIGELAVKAIKQAGVYLNLNVPLDGEYKIGNDWSQTH